MGSRTRVRYGERRTRLRDGDRRTRLRDGAAENKSEGLGSRKQVRGMEEWRKMGDTTVKLN